jgi:hypothetical protein
MFPHYFFCIFHDTWGTYRKGCNYVMPMLALPSLNPNACLEETDHHALALGANVRVAIRVLNHLRDDDDEKDNERKTN